MRRRCALSLTPLATLLLWLSLAHADGAPRADEWPVERNAQQLRAHEWKLGLFSGDVALHERVQLGTLWASWALLGPNVHLKGLLLKHRGWQLAAELSFLHLNLERLSWFGAKDISGRFTVLPVELHLDKQVRPRLLLGLGSGYALTHTSPKYDPRSLSGSAAYDSWFLHGHLTGRVGRRVWLVLEADWVLYQTAGVVGRVDTQLNEYIHVRGSASALTSPLEPLRGGATALSVVFRARRFGFRFGLGYGNFVLPRVRIVVPGAVPFVLLDVFARFGAQRSESIDPGTR